jgi:SAM-dependent methyltransferase
MSPRRNAEQRDAFAEQVEAGVYSLDFEHSSSARSFFAEAIRAALASTTREPSGLSVLECGCGPGAWLDLLPTILEPAGCTARYYGFDLTAEMVDLARRRLRSRVPREHLRIGDVLDPGSYIFPDSAGRFDLIYAYDVVQQLPLSHQRRACETMVARLTPTGVLVLFDQERYSLYGLKMGAKKLLTRYVGLNLVPYFYCNARYPALSRLSRRLDAQGYLTRILRASTIAKRALVVRTACSTER